MTDDLDRVAKLVALAASAPEHEARSAGLAAARLLVRRFGLKSQEVEVEEAPEQKVAPTWRFLGRLRTITRHACVVCGELATWELADLETVYDARCSVHADVGGGASTPLDLAREASRSAGDALKTAARGAGEAFGRTAGRGAVRLFRDWIGKK